MKISALTKCENDGQIRWFLSCETGTPILSTFIPPSHLHRKWLPPTRTERVQSNTRSNTRSRRRQRNRTSPAATASDTERSWHQPEKCINPEERKKVVENQSRDQTGYVYHLWHGLATDKCPEGVKDLVRRYLSPELAKHDALCWLIDPRNRAAA